MDFWVPMALAILFEVIKDKERVHKLKKGLRKLRDALMGLDLDDDT